MAGTVRHQLWHVRVLLYVIIQTTNETVCDPTDKYTLATARCACGLARPTWPIRGPALSTRSSAPASTPDTHTARSMHGAPQGAQAGSDAARPQNQLRSRAVGLGVVSAVRSAACSDPTFDARRVACAACARWAGPSPTGAKTLKSRCTTTDLALVGHRREPERVAEGDLEASLIANSSVLST